MRRVSCCIALAALFTISVVRVQAADTDSITAKSDDGTYLALDDGSEWLIAPIDQKTVELWLVADDVVVVGSSRSCSATELINTDENNESVCAVDASSYTSSISDKSDDGKYISLDDGSQWIVDDADTATSSVWTETDDIVVLSKSRFCTNAELIDTDSDGDEVCASTVQNH